MRVDVPATERMREQGWLVDKRSYLDVEGNLHLHGEDMSVQRKKVFYRDKGLCRIKLKGCTTYAEELDHVISRGNGGTDNLSNLQAACGHCHTLKHNRYPKWAKKGEDTNGK